MSRLAEADRRRAAEASACLATVVDGGPPGLAALVPELRRLLGTELGLAFGIGDRGEGLAVDFIFGYGAPIQQVRIAMDEEMRRTGARFGGFDARRPERRQRNVPLTLREMLNLQEAPPPVIRDLYPRFGIAGLDQLRVLVCDGPALLAWVGGFRSAPFVERDKQLLSALVPALRRRLRLEAHLGQAPVAIAALAAALEALGTAAFVVKRSGAVVHANAAGRALLDRDRRGVMGMLLDRLRGTATDRFDLMELQGGVKDHYLALLREATADPLPRAAAAARRWGLTPREAEVLGRLARGEPNKTIAATLGCSPNTVELHVSAILAKAGCESRAQLVARFWTGP